MKFYTNNSYALMQAGLCGQASLEYPQKLYLDITQDCNLYCKMCRDKLQIEGKTMPIDLFCRLIDETASYISSYSLFNWGEPLILKDFRERVEYVYNKKRADCEINISTNGMLLTKDMVDFLLSRGVTVTVSFDSSNKETFESIRCGSNFERICDNLKYLAKAYSDVPLQKAPEIYTSIQKENQNQLLSIAEFAYSLGIRRMGYGLVTAPIEYAPKMNSELRHQIEMTSDFINKNKMLSSIYPTKVGDYLWHGDNYLHKNNFILDTNCNAPFTSASVAYNGDVFLCCNYGELAGSVLDKSFKEVWQGAKYNELRSKVNSATDKPHRCKACAWVNRN